MSWSIKRSGRVLPTTQRIVGPNIRRNHYFRPTAMGMRKFAPVSPVAAVCIAFYLNNSTVIELAVFLPLVECIEFALCDDVEEEGEPPW